MSVLNHFHKVRARILIRATGVDGTDEEAFSEVSTEAIASMAGAIIESHDNYWGTSPL
ncbi:hypothetical protein [Acaryochloris sp. IP29b_bin.137]|uniref:hypothetical protein n=1 Tax=Acaryochloris sp. IP29b_bin.137 TaxID=2969217 RepID=UPI00261A3799|nr:hypothetical protein [Acaryochloris sp. IP29b_bin.137]